MSDPLKCPKCSADLPLDSPAGLCPKCLLAAGFLSEAARNADRPKSGPDAPTTDGPIPGRGFLPPSPARLADSFPQLEILELIGQGGMGAVYKARQRNLDRLVALKIIHPEGTLDAAFAKRFNREAKLLARLSHQHIVALYEFGEIEFSEAEDRPARPLYYFLMEYVDGANLRQLMQTGELIPERALAIVPQICDALQYAHDEGVVHRDIKPENILLDKRGRMKIADFGLAKLVTAPESDFALTGTHQVMGTPRYMAPEQMEGSHGVDHRADIYSLGVVFYEMLTGEVPAGHFDPPSKKMEIDVRLDEVVLKAMAREPERRYQQASEVKTDVESISSECLSGVSDTWTRPATSGIRQRTENLLYRRMPVIVSVIALALSIAGIWAAFTSWGRVYNDVSNHWSHAVGFGWWQGMLVFSSFSGVVLVLIATIPWRRIPTFRTALLALAGILALYGSGSFLNEHTKGTLPVQPYLDTANWSIEIDDKRPRTINEAKVATVVEAGPYVTVGLAIGILVLAAVELAAVGWLRLNQRSEEQAVTEQPVAPV
jgi:serine/threonine protein kinase